MPSFFARLSGRGLALGLATVTLAVPAVALAVDLTSGAGLLFDIQDFSSGELSNGSIDAYDGCYYLEVDGIQYSAGGSTTSGDGRTVTLNAATMGSLRVQRMVYVPASGGSWARYLDVFENMTSSDVHTSVHITGNLGSDGSTVLLASSSGDSVLSTADSWFSTDDGDGSGDPSLAHVFQGDPASGPLSPATSVSLATDNLDYGYELDVPAGGRVALLTFAVQDNSQALVQAEAARIIELPDDVIVGLDEYSADIVNFALGSFTEPCVGIAEMGACTTPRGDAGSCRSGSCCAGCWNGTRCVSGRSAAGCGRRGANCAVCADSDACTSDICSDTGTCTYPDAPRGTVCDDGLFCTASDRCDGAGNCGGAGNRCDDGISCTVDSCAEATDSCVSTPPSDQCIIGRTCVATGATLPGYDCLVCDPVRNPRGWSSTGDVCAIGGECVAPGTHNATYPCLVCDPTRNANDWSPLAPGEVCRDAYCAGGHVVTAATCSTTGACMAGTTMACDVGYCSSPTECASTCADADCPPGTYCAPTGSCERRRANASSCGADDDCVSGHCVDGICCSEGCTEECRSCIVPGAIGTCTDVPAMTDPDGECGVAGFCDATGVCSHGDAGPVMGDAGPSPDAGVPVDAARYLDSAVSAPDAGSTEPPSEGCSCAVPGAPSRREGISLVALAALGLLVGRRRRAR